MNILNKTRCYLIGGMENFQGQPWRDYAKTSLKHIGITFFDPYHKPFINEVPEDDEARKQLKQWMENSEFDKVNERMKLVRADDLRCCDLADFSIMQVSPNVPTWGSMEEAATVNKSKKPLFVFVEGGKTKCPLWIMGMIPNKYIYNNIEEVITIIESINSGKKQTDSDRWHLLKEEYR